MTRDESDAEADARAAAEDGVSARFLERLGERVGGRASVRAVFGEPVERGAVTVIPIARVRWGFGGGDGSSNGETAGTVAGSGSGGGGGVVVDPVGWVEIGPAGATFRRIAQPLPSAAFLLAAGISAAIVLRSLARFVR